MPGDDVLLDLGRALHDAQHLGVPQQLLNGILLAAAVAAKDLNGVDGVLHGVLAGDHLAPRAGPDPP